ncbi:sigma-70 family RNA polymerase sigma factor [Streptomyces sp. NPDC093510]|uniref:RNA polymerase sigma factor n=1 Tax=Streptomyces sp. NPDC093510 TaxID=3155199 RepID=UPI00343B38AE
MVEPEAVTAESLGRVFVEFRGEMTGKAAQLLRDAGVPASVADADDIVSSALATALRDPGAVRQPRAYLYKLIRTEVVHLAARCAEHRRLDEKHAADPLCRPAPVVADFSALVDNREAVHRAVRELSVPQRTAVWATHALDHTRNETAVLMGKHPGTVAQHSRRALALLRASIAAVVVGVLTVLGFAAGGGLEHTTPADDPGGEATLPPGQWWSQNWTVTVVTTVAGIVGAVVLWGLRRGDRDLARRLAAASDTWSQWVGRRGRAPRLRESAAGWAPLATVLCTTCHRRMDVTGLTPDEHNALLHRQAEQTAQASQAGHTEPACVLCGRSSSKAPLEAAHIVPVHGESSMLHARIQRVGRGRTRQVTPPEGPLPTVTYLPSADGPSHAPWADPTARFRLRDALAEPVGERLP